MNNLCKCGCGLEVKPGNSFINYHQSRNQSKLSLEKVLDDIKVGLNATQIANKNGLSIATSVYRFLRKKAPEYEGILRSIGRRSPLRNKFLAEKWFKYENQRGEKFQSKLEFLFAKFLLDSGADYEVRKILTLKDGRRKYPDFYLKDLNLYVEVVGLYPKLRKTRIWDREEEYRKYFEEKIQLYKELNINYLCVYPEDFSILNSVFEESKAVVPISEVFYSITGEGFEVGTPTSFVRFSFCNLRCNHCDTQYAWYPERSMSLRKVLDDIKLNRVKNVFITGGEPMICKELSLFINMVKRHGYYTILQTNGTRFDGDIFDKVNFISCDVKTPCFGVESDLLVIRKISSIYLGKSQFKFVLGGESDWKYMTKVIGILPEDAKIVLQPFFIGEKYIDQLSKFYDWILPKISKFPGKDIRILPQLHRILWGSKRGV